MLCTSASAAEAATSDNVVRAGCTPKFKDVDTLCSIDTLTLTLTLALALALTLALALALALALPLKPTPTPTPTPTPKG